MSVLSVQEFLFAASGWPTQFSLSELFRSDLARQKGYDNLPTSAQLTNVRRFVSEVLLPARRVWDGPLLVLSCFRSKATNQAAGGVATSYHLANRGAAADLTTASKSAESVAELFNLLKDSATVPFAELIYYQSGTPRIHIGWDNDPQQNVRELLVKQADGSFRRYGAGGVTV